MTMPQRVPAGTIGGGIQPWKSTDLFQVMEWAGFDPEAAGSEWAVIATDLHTYYTGGLAVADSFDPRLQDELQRLASHPPAACLVLGDILTKYCGSYGAAPDTTNGDLEAAAADVSMDWFDELATTYLILGNHDTGPDESPLGTYLASKLPDHFSDLHHALTIGGVRFVLLSTSHDAALDSTATDYLATELAGLTSGQQCVIATHQPGGGRAADGRCLRDIAATVPAGLTNELWSIAGHNHRSYQVFAYDVGATTLAQWEIGAGQGSWTAANPFGSDDTNPSMGAIACRDGEVVGRFAWEGKSRYWFFLPEFSRASPATVPGVFDGLAGETILASYVEGEYDRTGRLNAASLSTYRIAGSWLSYCIDITANFPIPSGATQFFIILTVAPDTIDVSDDGATWQAIDPVPSVTLSALTFTIPVGLQSAETLHVKIGSVQSTFIGAWGFLS